LSPSRLESLIARARHLDVKPEHARVYVADLDRWARRESAAPQRRWPAFAAGFGAAAALAALAFWLFGPDTSSRRSDPLAINITPLPLAPAADAPSDAAQSVVADALVAPAPVVATPTDARPSPAHEPSPHELAPSHEPPRDAELAAPTESTPAGPTVNERWRSARLLRSQGKFAEAILECEAIADTHDPTWAPIALLEAARIELGPLAAPERAVTYVERFEREWAGNGLLPEARDLRCRALGQLGRTSECGSGH
jgi:hypothetical protein